MKNSLRFSKLWYPLRCGRLASLSLRLLLLPFLASSYGAETDLSKSPSDRLSSQESPLSPLKIAVSCSGREEFNNQFPAFKKSSYMDLFLELKNTQIDGEIVNCLDEISKLQGVKFERPVDFTPQLITDLLPLSKKGLKKLEIYLRSPSFGTVVQEVWRDWVAHHGQYFMNTVRSYLNDQETFLKEQNSIFNRYQQKMNAALDGIQNLVIKAAPSLDSETMSRIALFGSHSPSPSKPSLRELLGFSPNQQQTSPIKLFRGLELSPVKTPEEKAVYPFGVSSFFKTGGQKEKSPSPQRLPSLQVSGSKINIQKTPKKPKVKFVPFNSNFQGTDLPPLQVSGKKIQPFEISGKKNPPKNPRWKVGVK